MRIAYICADPGIPVSGTKGCSVHVQEVIRAMVRAGHSVTLFAARIGSDVPDYLPGVQVVPMPLPTARRSHRREDVASREQDLLGANRTLELLLRSHGPFDLVYERYSLWSFAAVLWARSTGVTSVLEVNAPLVQEQQRHRQLHNASLAGSIARSVFRGATAVVAVSDEVSEYVRDTGGNGTTVCTIPNGFNAASFEGVRGQRRPGRGEPLTIGFVGSLKPWHGVSRLVDAVADVQGTHDLRLLIVGDGPERTAIEEKVRANRIDGITTLTGAISHSDIPHMLGQMDVGTAPYGADVDFYFSPMKVVEYMAAAACPVVSATGQLRTLVNHDKNGLLCVPGDVQDLARAIRECADDPVKTSRLGEKARLDIASQTWDAVVRRSIQFADSAVTARRSLREVA